MRSREETQARLAEALQNEEAEVCRAAATYLEDAPAQHRYALLWMLDMAKGTYASRSSLDQIMTQNDPACTELAQRLIAEGKFLMN